MFVGMFVRKKKNKSGVISVQIIEKRAEKSVLIKTMGSSADPNQVDRLFEQGRLLFDNTPGSKSSYSKKTNKPWLKNISQHFNLFAWLVPNCCWERSFTKSGLTG
ncbi:MAG TPA: hypothetical protein DEG28_00415 [Porphyromonadaceae bacterium]|nr:hypothetical protein [Porphyromonadaceae bacterium]